MLGYFDMSWVVPMGSWKIFSFNGISEVKFVRDNILWKLVYATIWKLWLERNNRVCTVSEWVSNRKEFAGISLEDLNRSWAAILKKRLPF